MSLIKYFLKKLFGCGDVSTGTIVRTVCLFLSIINSILVATGHPVIPISNERFECFVTDGAVIVSSVIAWWKNNSFTPKAIAGDNYKNTL